ncbi:hypothetical protein GHT06_014939 [Daphnia sinensis]|uniref:Uncharacterized protein n=1 Tax=Daphnia sinensis TaxID=1820382 RepID=A0AAD5KQK4_9CRUS|nr:hypothetical protein GHT06_014939 [Daphnia sinensis]
MAELFYTKGLAKRSATCLLFIQNAAVYNSHPRPCSVRVQSTLVYRPAELLCSNA